VNEVGLGQHPDQSVRIDDRQSAYTPVGHLLERSPQLPAERAWNVWELERLARAGTGTSAVLDEERCYLLIYLRQFASADGMLPVQFDPLVREAFAELLGTLPA
jgi:hypothetical protein